MSSFSRTGVWLACVVLTAACPTPSTKCTSSASCAVGQVCTAGVCTVVGAGGGTGGGGGGSSPDGGAGGGTGGGSGGGMSTCADEPVSPAPPQGQPLGAPTPSCDAPEMLAAAGMVTGSTAGDDVTYDYGPGCRSASGPDRVYSLSVPAATRLSVTVDAPWDVVINIVAAPATNCGVRVDGGVGEAQCLSSADSNSSGIETASYGNPGAAAQQVFIHLAGYGTSASGAFTMTTTFAPLVPGDACASAVDLPTTQPLTLQTLSSFSDDYRSSVGCGSDVDGPDRVYKVRAPAGSQLTVTAVPDNDAGVPLTVNLVTTSTCNRALSCAAGTTADAPGRASKATYTNGASCPRDVFVVVDADAPFTGTFTLTAAVSTAGLTVGEVCENATVATPGMLTGQTFAGYSADYAPRGQTGCGYDEGPDRVYAVDVPAGQNLTARVLSDAGVTLSMLEAAAACRFGPCTSSSVPFRSDDPVVVRASNASGTSSRRVLLVVDAADDAPATFDLSLAVSPPAQGESCTLPQVVSMSGTLTGQTTDGFSDDIQTSQSSCTGFDNDGPDRVYQLAVGAGQTLSATVTPTTAWDPAIYLIEAPASNCAASNSTCLAGSDTGGDSDPDTAGFTNSGAATTVYVVVDGFTPGEAGGFDLTLTLTP